MTEIVATCLTAALIIGIAGWWAGRGKTEGPRGG